MTCYSYKNLTGNDFESAKREVSDFPELDATILTSVYLTSWINVHGECILLHVVKADNEIPIFGTSKVVWEVNLEFLVFRLSMLETVNFSECLNAYRVQEASQATGLELILPNQLLSHEVVHIFHDAGDQYVSPKTYVNDPRK